MMKNTLISGATNFFSTSQSKQEKNKSNGPKGKTPEEDEGKRYIGFNCVVHGCSITAPHLSVVSDPFYPPLQ